MNGAMIRLLEAMLKELDVRVDALLAERDELKRERDELRTIIESAGRVLAGEERGRVSEM